MADDTDVDLDPTEHTVSELEDKLAAVEDPSELDAVLAAEQEGDDRKTAREAIQSRIDELQEETEGGDAAADTDHEEEYADEGGTDAPEEAGGADQGEAAPDEAGDEGEDGEAS